MDEADDTYQPPLDEAEPYLSRDMWEGYIPLCMRCATPTTGAFPDADPAECPEGVGTWGDVFCSVACAGESMAVLDMLEVLGDQTSEVYGLFKPYPDVFRWGDRVYTQRLLGPTSDRDATMRHWFVVVRFSDSPMVVRAVWNPLTARMDGYTDLQGDTSREAWEHARRISAILLDKPGPGRPEGTTKLPLDEFAEQVARVEAEHRAVTGRPPRLDDLAAELDVSPRTIRNYRHRWGKSGK